MGIILAKAIIEIGFRYLLIRNVRANKKKIEEALDKEVTISF